jgi:UDP-N-acetylglucosamine diphosphorylase/glucosamine-1-phosphate N-acetyltransferase
MRSQAVLALSLLLTTGAAGLQVAAVPGQDPQALQLGSSVDRRIDGDQPQEFRIVVGAAGTFLRVTVQPETVELDVELLQADGATIRAFSHIEGATISTGCEVGPFARLRPGTMLAEGAKVGNFVEVKKAALGKGAKANHLSYIGDAEVGEKANIGAGTITCNYDGFGKYRTEIGAGAFIGSNSALVAPVIIGEGAIVGAGSVVTKNVAADELAIARGEQRGFAGWAARFRAQQKAKKGKR